MIESLKPKTEKINNQESLVFYENQELADTLKELGLLKGDKKVIYFLKSDDQSTNPLETYEHVHKISSVEKDGGVVIEYRDNENYLNKYSGEPREDFDFIIRVIYKDGKFGVLHTDENAKKFLKEDTQMRTEELQDYLDDLEDSSEAFSELSLVTESIQDGLPLYVQHLIKNNISLSDIKQQVEELLNQLDNKEGLSDGDILDQMNSRINLTKLTGGVIEFKGDSKTIAKEIYQWRKKLKKPLDLQEEK